MGLLNSGDQRPFDEIMADFNSNFPHPLHFTLWSRLSNLLRNKKMLIPTQRLVTLAILNQTYSSEQSSSNPFIPFLINDHSILKRERQREAFPNYITGCQIAGPRFPTSYIWTLQLVLDFLTREINPITLLYMKVTIL